MLGIVLRLVCSAAAVWLSTVIISGIKVSAETGWGTIGTLLLVALLIGAVNTVIKPIVKFVGCGLYILTLGLIALVVNGLLFWLVSWIAGQLSIPFHVDNFWPSAVLGALLVSVVAWALGLLVKDRRRTTPPPPPPPLPPRPNRPGTGPQSWQDYRER